ncbi:hypothetical protein Nepgr_021729 [Nepenthes gracilis]|uniref:DUF4283 domain-containing protein n=1 Tax=Nepenthes gracilis TaxID=150966 RepID=A0AAD3XWB4_NEPGR|nr:hypothetical protein Nepgr_021729 [Nepenthes gracilis]
MEKCLASGPWFFAGHPLFHKRWNVGMPLSKEGHKTIPIWIKLFNVPVEYWTILGLSWIASAVSKPTQLDFRTAKMERLNFARICVEVSVDTELPPKIRHCPAQNSREGMESCIEVVVEYQWKPARRDFNREAGLMLPMVNLVIRPMRVIF